MNFDKTMNFSVERDKNIKAREVLKKVYNALQEKGYNPINQIVGYLMSGDPGYISNHKESRNKILKFDRTKILEVLLKEFIK